MTYDRTVDELVELVRPELEAQVDRFLEEQSPADRALLMRQRERLIDKLADATAIANLRHRNRELEARLRPTLVHDAEEVAE